MYLEMNAVTKVIAGETVLNQVNLSMDRGKIYGLWGKNGSGKTMIMRAICGLIRPTEGEVIIDGEVLGEKKDFPESVGVLIENPGFIGKYTGYQNLKMLADIKKEIGKEEIEEILKKIGLRENADKKYKKYSLGMKQKLGIAAALMENPEMILLDEPTNALDEESVKNLRGILLEHKKRGALIILASHEKDELKALADEIYVVENGKIKKEKQDEE
ncbi:MAG: ATP-binding cassette domain-containing protein [Lachnospiraceae bacterium]